MIALLWPSSHSQPFLDWMAQTIIILVTINHFNPNKSVIICDLCRITIDHCNDYSFKGLTTIYLQTTTYILGLYPPLTPEHRLTWHFAWEWEIYTILISHLRIKEVPCFARFIRCIGISGTFGLQTCLFSKNRYIQDVHKMYHL